MRPAIFKEAIAELVHNIRGRGYAVIPEWDFDNSCILHVRHKWQPGPRTEIIIDISNYPEDDMVAVLADVGVVNRCDCSIVCDEYRSAATKIDFHEQVSSELFQQILVQLGPGANSQPSESQLVKKLNRKKKTPKAIPKAAPKINTPPRGFGRILEL